MPGPETPGPSGEPKPPIAPRPHEDKGFSPETSGGSDTGQPAGISGAEQPSREALELNWGCIAMIAVLFLVGAIAWFISGG